jgi:3-deoxy-manno-octulosonate cytidylyltransferase (CMP-KDO synthetase)
MYNIDKTRLFGRKGEYMIIIPARLASSRLPNKVLADIGGLPMVVKTAKAVEEIDSVVIATDSQEVVDAVKNHGLEAVLTSESCKSGTDRIYEAAQKLQLNDNEIIINVQADEPFIEQDVVQQMVDITKENVENFDVIATSCYKIIDAHTAQNPNIVKVVTNLGGRALYFSRSLVPYCRNQELNEYKAHLGLYGFTMKKLEAFCSMDAGVLEDIEKLEQLRILDNGYQIALAEVESSSFGIDTKEDLDRALRKHIL